MLNLAVIGDPIAHSLSPMVHGAALEALKVPYTYQKVQVKKGELKDFLAYAKEQKIDGFNLTMPHKVDILPYLTEMDESAKRFEAVNTVKVKDGKLYGYNTDAKGYTVALNHAGYQFKESRVLILGAGGVVRTLALEAAFQGAKEIRILNRTEAKAEEIVSSIQAKVAIAISGGCLAKEELNCGCEACDIFINATPLGMHGMEEDFQDVSFLEHLPKHALVSDLIYNPQTTTLLRRAKDLSLATLNGMGMLIYQALLADQIYLDDSFDMKSIYEIVAETIKR